MNTCKNCGKEYKEKRVYCSYKCRNIYVNKNLRDYSKNGESLRKKGITKYLKKPKYCKECNLMIPYEKRENIFCNSSCGTKHTNRHRDKLNYTKEGLINLRKSHEKLTNNRFPERINYKDNPNTCTVCNKPFSFKKRKNKFCSRECITKFQRKDLSEYQKYYRNCQFKFSLNEYPDEYNFSLIEEHGWYSAANRGNNLYGVSRDHIFSIKEGFEKGVDSKLISHPANCRLLPHSENVSKFTRSDITIDDLKIKINLWNEKYNIK